TFERGINEPTGYVLPLRYMPRKNGLEWQSGLWLLRARHLYLVPGDSPIGFRLPVSNLPWEPVGKRQKIVPVDPMAPLAPLPVPREAYQAGISKQASGRVPARSQIAAQTRGPVVRTALAVEAREGRLYVFLPPVETTEGYVELVAAIEDTAASLE